MASWRYLAQNVLTGAWLETDLPLTVDAEQPRWELGGAGSLTGTIDGDHQWLKANDATVVLAEWQTVLYAELDGEIAWGGIIQSSDWDGPDWRVQAFGYVSYANGLPYTGGYQKLVDADPGKVWTKLWQHIQSQPDGDLGLKSIMPAQLGPNIGTKDEPYELSWWEAKDIGSELQQLASEAPFDYVESHRWTVSTVTGGPTAGVLPSFRLGYGNLQGAKPGNSHDNWQKNRADDQTDLIASMAVDIFVAVELHEEPLSGMPDGTHQWFAGRMRAKQSPFWQIAVGDGGNHALYRADVVALVSYTKRAGIDDPSQGGSANMRSASLWTFRHLATGQLARISGRHLHSDDNDGDSRRGSRLAEAADVRNLDGGPQADTIAAGDWNSYSMGADEVYGIVKAQTGLVPMNARTVPLNADLNSYGRKPKRQGKWIDNILSNPLFWQIDDAQGVPTRGLSDHQLWLSATFTPVSVPAGVTLDPSKKVTHTVELFYPRAGRRRLDLRFVQGENVTDVVQASRPGEEFANGVLTLGKGEGSKTVRGESVVRDGRLRRVTVYTDKMASTKSRCEALAKRERGYRGLGVQVESVLVADHPNAPMRSWALGDDILVEADLPHLGRYADWHRVMSWSRVTDSTARLYLERADAFTYGPVVPPPSDDTPDDDTEVGDR